MQGKIDIYKGPKKVAMVQRHRAKVMKQVHRNRAESTGARAYGL